MNLKFALSGGLSAFFLLCSTAGVAQPVVDRPAPTLSDAPVEILHATVLDVAVTTRRHTQLVRLLQASGLAATLETPGPFTVLAPDDNGFTAWGQKRVDALLNPANSAQLRLFLESFVLKGYLSYDNLSRQLDRNGGTGSLQTLNGLILTVTRAKSGDIVISGKGRNAATVTKGDVPAFNGTLISLTGVFDPPAPPKN